MSEQNFMEETHRVVIENNHLTALDVRDILINYYNFVDKIEENTVTYSFEKRLAPEMLKLICPNIIEETVLTDKKKGTSWTYRIQYIINDNISMLIPVYINYDLTYKIDDTIELYDYDGNEYKDLLHIATLEHAHD